MMVAPARKMVAGALSWGAAGLLAALSFVATPAKFLATNVPLEHLLAVGRVTFRASLAAEGVLLFLLLLISWRRLRWWPAAIAALLAAQHLLLMPALDARTLAVMEGAVLAPSPLHALWVLADVLRIGGYGVLGTIAWRSAIRGSGQE